MLLKGNGFMFTRFIAAIAFALVCWPLHAADGKYDPLQVSKDAKPLSEPLDIRDEKRGREIPIRVYRVESVTNAPVVLFSHGLGGTRDMSKYLGEHWSMRGYVVVCLQHPGSDDSVWRDAPLRERMQAMRDAASAENLKLRVQDVHAVLDQLEKWNATKDHPLSSAMSLNRVGMSGHSFGAQTTQAVAGQWMPLVKQEWTDPRVAAAVIMSPGSPPVGAKKSFGDVSLPWLLMTGTEDVSPIGGQTVESRRAVFPALPAGDKYELVLDKARHSVFTDRELPREQRNPNHHRAILSLSTAFWDAYIKQDPAAKAWLTGDGPKSVLEEQDIWQKR